MYEIHRYISNEIIQAVCSLYAIFDTLRSLYQLMKITEDIVIDTNLRPKNYLFLWLDKWLFEWGNFQAWHVSFNTKKRNLNNDHSFMPFYLRKIRYCLHCRSNDNQRTGCYWLAKNNWTDYNPAGNNFKLYSRSHVV